MYESTGKCYWVVQSGLDEVQRINKLRLQIG